MNYLSVCSGIEAVTVAWHPLGWNPIAFSEIESFPNKVLAYHYPDVPNLGDMTKFKEWKIGTDVDVLVGGTPCQSFSVAGLRKGLADPRGNLMLTYLAIADKYRPEWLAWENVPGVLSSSGGRDFGTFLGGLGQLGYGFAYRVLDAQYVRTDGYPHAVPQRRRRVFVVGHIGSWQRAAAVLFDSESLRGNPPPRREAGKDVAGTFTSRAKSGGWSSDVDLALITIGGGFDVCLPINMQAATKCGDKSPNMLGIGNDGDPAPTMGANDKHAVAFKIRGGCEGGGKGYLGSEESTFTLSTTHDQDVFTPHMQVRRLTPRECERLQAFPDDYTNIPGASDTTRYKALGNSMAVNVMQVIGQRIQMVSEI